MGINLIDDTLPAYSKITVLVILSAPQTLRAFQGRFGFGRTAPLTKPGRKPSEPLRTRHVFLDTEVYRRAGFNVSNTAFALLAKEIAAGRIILHITDITLAEIHRQLNEMVLEKAADAKRLTREFNRIAQITGQPNGTVKEVDGAVLADEAWSGFVAQVMTRMKGHSILALEIPPRVVFERYFSRQAPFQERGSKEFPDAFVVESLARYCRDNEITMYVVSGDAALRRAAESHNVLIPLQTIDEILAAAATAPGSDEEIEELVDDLFAAPGFDDQVAIAIEQDLDFVDFKYFGDLPDGSVQEAKLEEVVGLDEYRVAAFDGKQIGLIVQVVTVLNATVRYLDEDELRDKDDDIIPTELEISVRTHARLKLFVSINLADQRFTETELLTRDVIVE